MSQNALTFTKISFIIINVNKNNNLKVVKLKSEEINMKIYYFTTNHDGKVYDIYCEKNPDGSWNHETKEAREVTDAKYLEWYWKNHKSR